MQNVFRKKREAKDKFCKAYVREKKKKLKLTIKTNIVDGQ